MPVRAMRRFRKSLQPRQTDSLKISPDEKYAAIAIAIENESYNRAGDWTEYKTLVKISIDNWCGETQFFNLGHYMDPFEFDD
jgi:hypothetical protein